MANVEHEAFACDEDLYTEDGLYGDTTLTDRTGVAHAWPIIKTLLGIYIYIYIYQIVVACLKT